MRAIALAALALLAGCASIDATRRLMAAEVAIEGARAAGAERHAPYEYASAQANFEKAREENARARYGDSANHAERAVKFANEATAKAREASPRGDR